MYSFQYEHQYHPGMHARTRHLTSTGNSLRAKFERKFGAELAQMALGSKQLQRIEKAADRPASPKSHLK